jgi:biuret amidohydrolase
LLLGRVAEFGVAKEGEAGADFVPWATPQPSDVCIKKIRISPFFGTELDAILRSLGVDTVVIGGVATDLAVSSAARDAHDRGYSVEVAASICVAANEEDHSSALATLKKLATVHE